MEQVDLKENKSECVWIENPAWNRDFASKAFSYQALFYV